MQIGPFSLPDVHGNRWSLDSWADRPILVVAFLGIECPLVSKYTPRLVQLASEYAGKGVQFIGINSNVQDTADELKRFSEEYGLPFPLLKDLGNRVADQFRAIRTPEVFVLDSKRIVRYWGRIDDQFGVGYRRLEAEQDYLRQAIDDMLRNRPVRRPAVSSVGCYIGRQRAARPAGEVTWCNQVSRIFQRRCQGCHRPGNIGPFSLLTYEDVAPWAETAAEVIDRGLMPPWHASPTYGKFSNDLRLNEDEKALIAEWVRQGAPEGDASQLPPPLKFSGGWPIGEPDEIIYMSEKPYVVPPEGGALYRYFFVDPKFKEDRWVVLSWCQPGNPAVVHHINVYFRPPWQDWSQWLGGTVNLISGFLPGQQPPPETPTDLALYVPAGSELVFEMHYTPNGTPQLDRSAVGLVYLDPGKVRRELLHVCAYNDRFRIPPYDPYFKVEADYAFKSDVALVFLCPHMHMRGKDFIYEANYPDGKRETLLEVKGYDYEWQSMYYLAQPKRLPRGTRMHCTAYFDNSSANVRNPDPSRTVRWSGYTEDEMMVGVMGIAREIDTTGYVPGKTLPGGQPLPPARHLSPGHAALDRGKFLEGKGDWLGASAQYRIALREFYQARSLGDLLRAVATNARLWLGRYRYRVAAYLLSMNVLALMLRLREALRWRRRGRHIPAVALALIALLGGVAVLLPIRVGERPGTASSPSSGRAAAAI
jgi:peroxiredoxin